MRIKKTIGFIVALAVCFLATMLIAQQTTREGWRGFNRLTATIERTETQAQQLYNEFVVLKKLKVNIIENTALFDEVKKVIDVHPDYTVTDIAGRINTLEASVKNLVENGLVSDVQMVADADGLTVYAGYSIHFTKEGEAGWAIRRGIQPDETSPPENWTWAGGEKRLIHKWTERATLSY